MTFETRFTKLLAATPEQLSLIDALLEGRERGMPPELADRRLLTFTAAAATLSVSRQTVWRMVKDGRLPTIEVRAGRHRVPSSALTCLLKGGAACESL